MLKKSTTKRRSPNILSRLSTIRASIRKPHTQSKNQALQKSLHKSSNRRSSNILSRVSTIRAATGKPYSRSKQKTRHRSKSRSMTKILDSASKKPSSSLDSVNRERQMLEDVDRKRQVLENAIISFRTRLDKLKEDFQEIKGGKHDGVFTLRKNREELISNIDDHIRLLFKLFPLLRQVFAELKSDHLVATHNSIYNSIWRNIRQITSLAHEWQKLCLEMDKKFVIFQLKK